VTRELSSKSQREEKAMSNIEVVLRADRHDGNDPLEAIVQLAGIPRKGDAVSVWDPSPGLGGGERFLDIEWVVFSAFEEGRIEAWVKMDGYDLDELERVMRHANAKASP
jgi:hypothetical protein